MDEEYIKQIEELKKTVEELKYAISKLTKEQLRGVENNFERLAEEIKERKVVTMKELESNYRTLTQGSFRKRFRSYLKSRGIRSLRLPMPGRPEILVYVEPGSVLEIVFSEDFWNKLMYRLMVFGTDFLTHYNDRIFTEEERKQIADFFNKYLSKYFEVSYDDYSITKKVR